MKSRNFNKASLCRIVCLLMVAIMLFMTACNTSEGDEGPVIKIQTSVTEGSVLTKGQEVTFMVLVSDDSPYTVSVSDTNLAEIKNGNTMRILSDVTVDTEIKLIVTINRLPDCKKEVKFLLKAPVTFPTVAIVSTSKAENSRLDLGDEITVNAVSSDGSEIVLSVSETSLATISGNVVKIVKQPEHETTLIVTATLKDYPTISASRSFYVKQKTVEGRVNGANGNVLTTELIQALGNKNITVNGTVTDVYVANDGSQETVEYKTTVKMNEGAWYGEWYAVTSGSETPNVIADSYRKGDSGIKDESGNIGSAFVRVYIDKNNKVASKAETSSMSYPYLWENNHLWNHLGEFAANVEKKFVYNDENDVFSYEWKRYGDSGEVIIDDAYDEYLMTYLAYSFTPMLDDTFENFYFKMENGKITQLLVKTAEVTSGSTRSYTEVVFTFENIGTTEVPEPSKYEDDERNDALQTAVDKMKAATSYTFSTEEITTQAPSYDDSDYTIESTYSAAATYAASTTTTSTSFPTGSQTGTVGITGKVVKGDAVLIVETGKYEYTLSGDAPYHMSYYGYKQVENDIYDEFELNAGRLEGTHQYSGSINDVLPSWDFDVNIFKFNGSTTDASGKTVTKYVLRDSAIMGDVAKEVCMHSNVKNTIASSQYPFEIAVDSDGNVVYTSFPYSYSSYSGYCKTTYSKVNSTTFTNEFDTYVARVLPEWSDLSTDKYYYKHTSSLSEYDCYDKTKDYPYHVGTCDHVATLDKIIEQVFGIDVDLFPTMSTFRQIFGDNIYTPYFFDYDEKTLANGTKEYIDFVSFTAQAPQKYLDDKNNLSDEQFTKLLEVMTSAFKSCNLGIEYSGVNSDYSGGTNGTSDRWVAFANDNYIISINNNHTRYFWIEIHKLGDWTLSK